MFLDCVTSSVLPGKYPGSLDSFQMALNFPDGLNSFLQMAGKVSRWPVMFLEGLECFQMAWDFPDGLDSFQMSWTVSRWLGKLPHGLESFKMA